MSYRTRKNGHDMLTDRQATWALKAVAEGMRGADVARRLKVSKNCMSRLIRGQTHTHIRAWRVEVEAVRQAEAAKRDERGGKAAAHAARMAALKAARELERPPLIRTTRELGNELTSNVDLGRMFGVSKQRVSQITDRALERLHVHLVAATVERSLREWTTDQCADVAAYVIAHNLGYALVSGRMTTDDVLDRMHDAGELRRVA